MGQTVVSATIQSHTLANDDESEVKSPMGAGVASVAFNSMGTSPSLQRVEGGGGKARLRLTSGSGSPAIAANNIVATLNTTRTPRKVYIAVTPAANAPGFHVASVGAGTVTIGTKAAPAASTQYDIEIIPVF